MKVTGSIHGPEFDLKMKALVLAGPRPGSMLTWWCQEDRSFHFRFGAPGCVTCRHYERRVEA